VNKHTNGQVETGGQPYGPHYTRVAHDDDDQLSAAERVRRGGGHAGNGTAPPEQRGRGRPIDRQVWSR